MFTEDKVTELFYMTAVFCVFFVIMIKYFLIIKLKPSPHNAPSAAMVNNSYLCRTMKPEKYEQNFI